MIKKIKNFILRLRLWLKPFSKTRCTGCCVTCRFFDEHCRDEFFGG